MNKRLFLVAVIVTVLTLFSSAVAQEHGPPPGGSDKTIRDVVSDVKGRSIEMERVRRNSDKREDPPATSNFPQIKEDFERIQIVNSDVLQANPTGGPLAYERISEGAAEINKRATRLKSNLFAEPAKQSKKSEPKEPEPGGQDQELKALLTLLDNSITSFSQSPIFQNTKVVNPEDSTNAQKELEQVIKLSARITLEADRMKKATLEKSPQ